MTLGGRCRQTGVWLGSALLAACGGAVTSDPASDPTTGTRASTETGVTAPAPDAIGDVVEATSDVATVTFTGTTTGTGTTTATGTDVVYGEELVNVDGWVGFDPATAEDNPLGFQGEWHTYGDEISCVPAEGNPCTAAGCCLRWETTVDSTHTVWGCGLGLQFNSSGGDAPIHLPYSGAAVGFAVTISGTAPPDGLLIGFTQAPGDPVQITGSTPETSGVAAPCLTADVGTWNIDFADTACPEWAAALGCPRSAVPSASYGIFFQVRGGDSAGFGTFCITSLRPYE